MKNPKLANPYERGAGRAREERRLRAAANSNKGMKLFLYLQGYEDEARSRRWHLEEPLGGAVSAAAGFTAKKKKVSKRANRRHSQWKATIAKSAGVVLLFAVIATPVLAYLSPETAEMIAASGAKAIPASAYSTVENNAACAMMAEVRDETGRSLGYWSKPNCENTSYLTVAVTEEGARNVEAAYVAVEGEISGAGTILNVNFRGLARAIFSGGAVGGTNFLQSSIEATAGYPNALSVGQKMWLLGVVGPGFTAEHLNTPLEKLKFAVENLQCAVGAPKSGFGPAIAGDLCAKIFGHDHLEQLTAAETCVLAASLISPLRIPAPNEGDQAIQSFIRQFDAIKSRAISKCAGKVQISSDQSIKDDIEKLELPDIRELNQIKDRLKQNLPFFPRIAEEFDLRNDGSTQIVSIQPGAQKRVVEAALALGESISPRLNSALCWSLECRDERADIAVMVVEVVNQVPKVRAAYVSRRRLLSGPVNSAPDRSVGSLTKGILLPLLLDAGQRRFCREPWADLHDASGSAGAPCFDEHDFVTIDHAFAISSNLAFAYGLRKVDTQATRRYLAALGYYEHGDLNANQLVRSTITGDRVDIVPLRLIQDYASLTTLGKATAFPSISASEARGHQFAFSQIVSERAIAESQHVLKAPILDSSGTLRSILKPLERLGCKQLFGKTGTSDSVSSADFRDKLVIAGGECRGKKLIAFVLVGSPDVRIPVGKITTHEIAGLAVRAVEASLKTGE